MFAPVPMALHAAHDEIRNSFFVVFFSQFGLIVAIKAGKTARAGRMAGSTHAVRTFVINREGVIEIGWQPA